MKNFGLPPKQGLYDPRFEHDACGIGFVADMYGRRSHKIVEQGIEVLSNLTHRGACGCDPDTGDGAGLLLQIPHELFQREADRLGFRLPEPGQYGVGMIFLSKDAGDQIRARAMVESIVAAEGQRVLGWRKVPTSSKAVGWLVRESEPAVEQVFIGRGPDAEALSLEAWERKLFVIRRRTRNEAKRVGLQRYYPATMSARTIVYKGLLLAPQIPSYYPDLCDEDFASAISLVHQRFSTNTFPTWERAQPFRYLAHNGEINTVRGNVNWMQAREQSLRSELFGDDIEKLKPIIDVDGSDSTMIDNALELLVQGGRSVAHALMMLVPEAWSSHPHMSDSKKAFYEYHATMMEPWDGPASLVVSDGRYVGGNLDRNGLRPSRYWVTHDGLVVLASESGVLSGILPEDVKIKGRLQPGRMFLVDTEAGRIIADEEIKEEIAARQPYRLWLDEELIDLVKLPAMKPPPGLDAETLLPRQRAFGYTLEDQRTLLAPMAEKGAEPIGSMGVDIPLACLSERPQLLYNYFKQLFAQVTNPAIDPIREELVMSTYTYVGPQGNLLDERQEFAHVLKVRNPILSNNSVEKLRGIGEPADQNGNGPKVRFGCRTLKTLFPAADGPGGLEGALAKLCADAETAADWATPRWCSPIAAWTRSTRPFRPCWPWRRCTTT